MAGSAPHIPKDEIEAAAQQTVQNETLPADGNRSSFSDVAESAPHIPKDDIEAVVQQSVRDENAPAGGDKSSHSDELPELTYKQLLYKYVDEFKDLRFANVFLNFDNLSRVNIIHLVKELAKYEQVMRDNKAAPQEIEHLGDLLHRYSRSVKFAMVIVFSLTCLNVSHRRSGPRILVQTLRVRL